jgi:hypothetical protein
MVVGNAWRDTGRARFMLWRLGTLPQPRHLGSKQGKMRQMNRAEGAQINQWSVKNGSTSWNDTTAAWPASSPIEQAEWILLNANSFLLSRSEMRLAKELTNSMVLCPSSEADISSILWNWVFRCRFHKEPQPVPIMSQKTQSTSHKLFPKDLLKPPRATHGHPHNQNNQRQLQ